ncbi:transglycosylase SLT domain-containing protein [Sulfitobacter delicatus]|jgi:soluble lytic murein transglycosylase-like protein|uniref:Transglycosylase SLT domain-containing protein n=1 Tax=Sulfitobacter delicatus TaxID=218672 RepID=A0A1G7PIY2_9RHOB|nr:transglycosylase SLT domain-containing protein [Sulfitobacter delicatus]SDF86178.1 Transglycosylase SLT domain-containing protein [Sulfitobacter delicatus]
MFQFPRRLALICIAATTLAACNTVPIAQPAQAHTAQAPALPLHPNETLELRRKINYWADHYELPRPLVHRLAIRESTHNPKARNGPYYGLLQILPATARSMGFQGKPTDLLDADTNLQYALKYLRGAWLLSNGDHGTAIKWYARGYYYEAKRRGMLVETGLRGG